MKSIVIAIVGRPNVGKSTLFNRLARKRIAIVKDEPGVTRDRNFAAVKYRGYEFTLIDTGGFEPDSKEFIPQRMREQSQLAVEEADAVIFLVDRVDGWNPQDQEIFDFLRRSEKPFYLTINKVDGHKHEEESVEFYESGVERIFPVSSAHGRGIDDLLEAVAEDFPEIYNQDEDPQEKTELSLALVGRQNAGKSSLVNSFLGKEKQIVSDEPGTTRDPIDTEFRYHGEKMRLIDTAGMKRKARVSQLVDKYSMIGSLRSIERADVVLLMIDAKEGVVEQDARIAGYVLDRHKALIIIVNKWDLVEKDNKTLEKMKQAVRDRLKFLDYAPILFVSAKTGQRVQQILAKVQEVYQEFTKRIQTADVNRILQSVTMRHLPPSKSGKPTKFYYSTQVAITPPTFVITTNHPECVSVSYERYVVAQFREHFGFEGTPVRIFFRKRERRNLEGISTKNVKELRR